MKRIATFYLTDGLPDDIWGVTDRRTGDVFIANDAPLDVIVHEAFHLAVAQREEFEVHNEEHSAQRVQHMAQKLLTKLGLDRSLSTARRRGERAGRMLAAATTLVAAAAFVQGYLLSKLVANAALDGPTKQATLDKLKYWLSVTPRNEETRQLLLQLTNIYRDVSRS